MQYIAIIEGDDESGYSAYVPDLSGCIAAAETREEIEHRTYAVERVRTQRGAI